MELFSKIIYGKNKQNYHANYIINDDWFYCKLKNYDDEPHELIPIDKKIICPIYKEYYTIFNNYEDKNLYYKSPLISFTEYDNNDIISMTNEIETYEKIKINGEHKNICKYYGCIVKNNIVESIVIKKYDHCLMNIEKITYNQRENIIKELKEGVSFLHSINIIHGDINPYNIMLDDFMNPIIIDFDSCGKNNLKMGTDIYMSNNYKKEIEDDIYSLNKTIDFINNIKIEN